MLGVHVHEKWVCIYIYINNNNMNNNIIIIIIIIITTMIKRQGWSPHCFSWPAMQGRYAEDSPCHQRPGQIIPPYHRKLLPRQPFHKPCKPYTLKCFSFHPFFLLAPFGGVCAVHGNESVWFWFLVWCIKNRMASEMCTTHYRGSQGQRTCMHQVPTAINHIPTKRPNTQPTVWEETKK